MNRPLFFILACTSSVLASADHNDMGMSLLVFGASQHFDTPAETAAYEEFNPGLGLKFTHNTDDPIIKITAQAGYYRNSYKHSSCFAGPGIQIGESYGVHLAALYLTGYDDLPYKFTIVPSAYISVDRYSLHATYVGDAMGFYLEIRL